MSQSPNPSAASTGPTAPASPTNTAVVPTVCAPSLMLMLCAGVLGVVLSWLLIEQFGSTFRVPEWVTAGINYAPNPEQSANITKYNRIIEFGNWPLRFAIFGALLGGLLSSAAARSRSATPVLIGALAGAALAGLGGAAVAALNQSLPGDDAFKNWSESYQSAVPTFRIILIHGTGFAIAGIGVSLAVSLAMRRRDLVMRCVSHGLVAGLLGGMLFGPLSAVLMPAIEETLYPKEGANRLLWLAVPGLLMAYGITTAMKPKPAKT
ncbi:MAG: hypothetical protein EXS05_15230 [Planctomycetaceae bacterium]|nr:hypothetical protein [Planctomycetaceae bacterium]